MRVLTWVSLALLAGAASTTAQTVLAIDFNARSADTVANTQPGFSSFTMTAASGTMTGPSTRTYGAYTVTVVSSAGLAYDDRSRTMSDSGSFTESALLKDFIFLRDNSGISGFDVTVSGLEPSTTYRFTMWAFDSGSTGNRVSDWSVNDQVITNSYAFNGAVAPTSNDKYRFSGLASSDAAGQVVIHAHRNTASVSAAGAADFGVFFNAFRIETPAVIPPVITGEPVGVDIYAGDHAVFGVGNSGTSPFQYHWLLNGNPLTVTSENRLVISNAGPANVGAYSVIVSNSSGTATSAVAQLTVKTVANISSGLVAYWPLDELDPVSPDFGPNHYDLWPTNVDITNLVDPRPGSNGGSVLLNGTDEFLMQTNAPGDALGIVGYPSYTVCVWVRGDGFSQTDRRVLSLSSDTNATPLFTIGTGNTSTNGADIFIRNNDGGNPINHRKTTLAAFDSQWHHIAWVDHSGIAAVYVDGIQDTNDFSYVRGVLTPTIASVGAVFRPTAATPVQAFYGGSIDELSMWRRGLSAAEITQVMTNGPLPPPQEPPHSLAINVGLSSITITFTSATPLGAHTVEQATDFGTPNPWSEVQATFSAVGNSVTAQFPKPASTAAFYRIRE